MYKKTHKILYKSKKKINYHKNNIIKVCVCVYIYIKALITLVSPIIGLAAREIPKSITMQPFIQYKLENQLQETK
jgi:hypothetical protein